MARRLQLEGRTVLITGAARGLGRELALRLAVTEGADLVLVDRDARGLDRLAEEIDGRCRAAVRTIARDLLAEDAARELCAQVADVPVHGLINNAGLTCFGEAAAGELARYRSIIDLDFRLTVELSLLFHARLSAQGGGFILNVTSLAAFLPLPYQAVYGAAKAAAQNFTECLRTENRCSPVLIATFAPSGLATEMVSEAGLSGHMEKHLRWYLTPQEAARVALAGLKRGKRTIVPGLANRLLYGLLQIVPRSLAVAAAEAVYRRDCDRLPRASRG